MDELSPKKFPILTELDVNADLFTSPSRLYLHQPVKYASFEGTAKRGCLNHCYCTNKINLVMLLYPPGRAQSKSCWHC